MPGTKVPARICRRSRTARTGEDQVMACLVPGGSPRLGRRCDPLPPQSRTVSAAPRARPPLLCRFMEKCIAVIGAAAMPRLAARRSRLAAERAACKRAQNEHGLWLGSAAGGSCPFGREARALRSGPERYPAAFMTGPSAPPSPRRAPRRRRPGWRGRSAGSLPWPDRPWPRPSAGAARRAGRPAWQRRRRSPPSPG